MKARLPRFLRLRSFWLGLPAFLFLLWVWRDSMIHVAALHRQQGAPVTMEWPPAETGMYLMPPEPELRPDPPARFDLEELSSYSEAGAAIQPPLLESRLVHLGDNWSLSGGGLHRVRRQEFQARFEEVRTYRSAGSRAGALWFSIWRSSRLMPEREYRLAAHPEYGFPAPEWGALDPMGNRTLRLPYWLLAAVYLGLWAFLMCWRLRRRTRWEAVEN